VVAADFTGDGVLDLLTTNYDTSDLTLAVGDGAGGFLPMGTFASGGDYPIRAAVGDSMPTANAT